VGLIHLSRVGERLTFMRWLIFFAAVMTPVGLGFAVSMCWRWRRTPLCQNSSPRGVSATRGYFLLGVEAFWLNEAPVLLTTDVRAVSTR
jgi:hypothetical protein